MSNGDIAAVVINWRELNSGEFVFNMADIGAAAGTGHVVAVRDLYEQKNLGNFEPGEFKIDSLPGHGCKALRFSVVSKSQKQ